MEIKIETKNNIQIYKNTNNREVKYMNKGED